MLSGSPFSVLLAVMSGSERPRGGPFPQGAALDDTWPPTVSALSASVTRQRRWVPRVAAWVCITLSLVNITALVAPGWHSHLAPALDLMPGVVENAAVLATTMAGVLLWFLAIGLARRKRRALVIAVILLAASLGVRVVAVEQVHLRATLPIAISVALLVFLLGYRSEFYALPDTVSRSRTAALFLMLLVTGTAAGYVFVEARARVAAASLSTASKLLDVWKGLIGMTSPLDSASGHDDDLVYYALLGIGVGMALVLLYRLLRAPTRIPTRSEEEESRIRALLGSSDADSLDYFALRPDKSLLWSPSGRACLAYGVVNGVALASGDPLGEPGEWPVLMREFEALARTHAWLPGVAGCSERAARLWSRTLGFQVLEIGDEAIADTATFSLDGRELRNLRHSTGRLQRRGFDVSCRFVREIPEAEREQLRSLARAWRKGRVERGYSMALGRVCDAADPDSLVAVASLDERTCGFIQFVPWGRDGLSLDLMRRDASTASGVMDLIITTVLASAPDMGIDRVSLNFAPFRSALETGERIGAAPFSRAWRRLLLVASRWTQIESIYRFNAKFRPRWEPRFIVSPTTRDLARVSTAYLRAEAFLPRPRASRRTADEPSSRPPTLIPRWRKVAA
jgi:lysyl-tRNA synthetase class 2